MPRARAVIFDLDGTLVDSLPGIQHSAQAAVSEVLPGCVLPDLGAYIGPPIGEMLQQALPGLADGTLARVVSAFRRHYDAEGWRRTRLYPGVEQTLAWLGGQGIRLFVVTNKPAAPTRQILEHLSIAPHFEAVCCREAGSPVHGGKVQITRQLLQDHHLDPAATWFVGDSGDDSAAAAACELSFILAAYGYGASRCHGMVHPAQRIALFADVVCLLSDPVGANA